MFPRRACACAHERKWGAGLHPHPNHGRRQIFVQDIKPPAVSRGHAGFQLRESSMLGPGSAPVPAWVLLA
jgi:hypothetical protein